MSLLYPRLSISRATELANEYRTESIEKLLEAVPEPAMNIGETYGETGGARVRFEDLVRVQREIRAIAEQHGFPAFMNREKAQQFDGRCGAIICERMLLTPHEASQSSVWQYVCCGLVPELVRWRFQGDVSDGTSLNRFMGGRRNTFGRLWWRAFILADDSCPREERYRLLQMLGEDELVQLMERPTLYGDSRLTRSIVKAFLKVASDKKLNRQTLMREVTKLTMRHMPLRSFAALEDFRLDIEVMDIVNKASIAMEASVI